MLNKRLKELRNEYGYTQKELGDKIGVNDNTITNYEKGIRQPSYEILENMASVFNCSIDYLLGRTDDRNITILKDNTLPSELKGLVDAIGVAKNAGLSEEDIKEILELHARMKNGS